MPFRKIQRFSFPPLNNSAKEAIVALCLVSGLIFLLSKLLFTNERMFAHDTIWFYGVFHYFADSLSNGFFPYWDPYDYSGQPFYSHLSIMHLINPLTVAFILFNKFMKCSILSLYHWQFVSSIIFANIGGYFFARSVTRNKESGILFFCVFLFSSFTYISLRQAGFLYSFMWFPWCMFFLARLLEKFNLRDTLGLALFLGLSLTGYQGLFGIVFILLFLFVFTAFKRHKVMDIARERKNQAGLLLFIIIISCLSMPLLSVYADKNDFIPMARMKTSPVDSSSFTDGSGAVPAEINDFRGLIFRDVAIKGYFAKNIPLSEGFLYIGLLPLLLAFVGIVLGKSKLKPCFIFTLSCVALLMLGEKGRLQQIVNMFFPPFRYVRHMQLFAPFLLFNLVFFAAQGFDFVLDKLDKSRMKRILILAVFLLIMVDLVDYGRRALDYVTLKRPRAQFSEYATNTFFNNRRQERLVIYDEFRYYRPALYKRMTALSPCTVPPQYSFGYLNYGLFELYSAMRRKDRFAFAKDAGNLSVKDFVEYGIADFPGWDIESRKAFLDILDVVLMDMGARAEYYSSFAQFPELYRSTHKLVLLWKKAANSPAAYQQLSPKVKELFGLLINLSMRLKPDAASKKFEMLDKEFSFPEMAAFHAGLYKKMNIPEYLSYLWGSSHAEDFSLLLSNNYQEFMRILSRQDSAGEAVMLNMAAVGEDMIRFYPRAVTLNRSGIISLINSGKTADALFIEDNLLRNNTGSAGALNTAEAVKGFEYKVSGYTPNFIELECFSPSDGFLYYSQGYDKYWRAYIDSRPAPVDRANLAFMALKLPQGRHTVVFRYKPVFYQVSLVVYYFCLAAVIYLLFRRYLRE